MAGQLPSHQPSSASVAAEGGGLVGLAATGWLMTPSFWQGPGGAPRLNLTTKETAKAIGSSRVFQRLRFHRWLLPLGPSRDQLYPWSRILAAQKRMEEGEPLPLLPSEIKAQAKRQKERKPAA